MAKNVTDSRETWLRIATDLLRPLFEHASLPLPQHIRFAIAFTSSGRKSKAVGETWHSPATADNAYEIIIRADISEPAEILTILIQQLVHAVVPPGQNHGKQFKGAAQKIGLEGKMRNAVPGPLLQERLNALVRELPPLPHAKLNVDWKAVDRKKKQDIRMHKAECLGGANLTTNEFEACGYTVRLSSKWAKMGALCPVHGSMEVTLPKAGDENPNEDETT